MLRDDDDGVAISELGNLCQKCFILFRRESYSSSTVSGFCAPRLMRYCRPVEVMMPMPSSIAVTQITSLRVILSNSTTFCLRLSTGELAFHEQDIQCLERSLKSLGSTVILSHRRVLSSKSMKYTCLYSQKPSI